MRPHGQGATQVPTPDPPAEIARRRREISLFSSSDYVS